MSDLQIISNHTTSDKFEFQNIDLLQNYSVLINKLEQLALGVDATLGNFSVDHQEVEVTYGNGDLLGDPIAASRAGPAHITHAHGLEEVEYSRVVSDIWIGVILTLLIVSVIFFICACFLYHKFQQWKNSYRTNNNDSADICRSYPPNYEVESLPSYTIVSGLPTYDDALEQFRKAGIILTPQIPIIKIFEAKDSKDIYNMENGLNELDSISIASCSCGAVNGINNSQQYLTATPPNSPANSTQFIELTPEQLAQLSQKRLSLQIAFPQTVRRNSRPRVDMRNNLLRSRAVGNTAGYGASFPEIHRASSTFSLAHERNSALHEHHMQHRDRTNNNDSADICRSYPPNYEVESLPSYTIVSGLPTYDDALEQFRKAGIILTPQIPIIKIFEAKDSKDIYNMENGLNELDSISIASCSCGAVNGINNSQQYLTATPPNSPANSTQFIELTPEQLAQLSQKRLSLQIAFPQTVRRNSRPRVDMRNNLLRSRAVGNTAGYGASFPEIHRASSTFSLAHERNSALHEHHMQHRGSLF